MSEVKTSRKLLVSEILRGDPCYVYSQRLADRFKDAVINVTTELAVSQADDWDWYWAASRLLTQNGYDEFSKIVNKAEIAQSNELEDLRKLARAKRELARAEYDQVLRIEVEKEGNWYSNAAYEAANKAYNRIVEPIDAALDAARKVTEHRVNVVEAQTFAELYISEEGTTDQTGNDKWYGRDDDYDSDEYEDDYDSTEDY